MICSLQNYIVILYILSCARKCVWLNPKFQSPSWLSWCREGQQRNMNVYIYIYMWYYLPGNPVCVRHGIPGYLYFFIARCAKRWPVRNLTLRHGLFFFLWGARGGDQQQDSFGQLRTDSTNLKGLRVFQYIPVLRFFVLVVCVTCRSWQLLDWNFLISRECQRERIYAMHLKGWIPEF